MVMSMSKILIMPNNTKQLNINCDGIIVGIKNLSVGVLELDIEEIKKIKNKEIFVSLNKNISNKELDYLKNILLELNEINIKGVIFYDFAIVNLKEELNLKYDLIWSQCHHTTNIKTADFLSEYVQGMWISNDITLEEMIKTSETKLYTMVTLFGYLPMFVSKRPLISNYLNTFNLENKNKYYISKEGKNYPIFENNGVQVYTDFVLNGLKESLILNKIDYFVLNGLDIANFDKIVELFLNVNENNISEYEKKLKELVSNLGKGFLYQETIYKVKK